jgi:hypothetical protein
VPPRPLLAGREPDAALTNSDQIAQMIQKWMTDKGLML